MTENKDQKFDLVSISSTIDFNSKESLLNYGAEVQRELAEYSDGMLRAIQKNDNSSVTETLNLLTQHIGNSDPDEFEMKDYNWIQKNIFRKENMSTFEVTAKYQKIGAQIDKIQIKLERELRQLKEVLTSKTDLYQQNKNYYDVLSAYIKAAEVKLEELNTIVIPAAEKEIIDNPGDFSSTELDRLNQFKDGLEKKIHNLKISRLVSEQQTQQIALMESIDEQLATQINESIVSAIPLWKNQIAIAMKLMQQKEAIEATTASKKNSKKLMEAAATSLTENVNALGDAMSKDNVSLEEIKKTQDDILNGISNAIALQHKATNDNSESAQEIARLNEDFQNEVKRMAREAETGF